MNFSRRQILKAAAAAGALLGSNACVTLATHKRYTKQGGWGGKTHGSIERIPSMCQACTTACGIIGNVKDGRLLTVDGNPEDPNSRGAICAKGAAGPSILYDPYRILYPLKRVGARGEGKWKRISWDEALDEIATKLKAIRDSGHPEEFAFQQGRNRSTDIIARFLNAYGTPSQFNHRAMCSLNKRAAILATIGDSDWDCGDYENADYMLNFGCNFTEAHQGHIPIVTRVMKAREKRGAKIVTFEMRLSNTAAVSDEWFCVKPGTDGLIALAMSNVICQEGLWNKEWFNTWSNYSADEYAKHLQQYTPELAEAQSGIPAEDIRRIAREFAKAAPRCTTLSARGSHAHWNGFYNDRAIILLNALVGNMGQEGGWNWHPEAAWDKKAIPEPEPVPEAPKVRSVIADAKDWPLANAWKGKAMRVGEIVYLWIKEGKQKISALMTYNCDQAWAWPQMGLVQDVLKDEKLLPFHFVLDVMYSESAHLADIILPWTTYLERWDIDSRPPLTLVDYVGLRQPVVKPLGESRDVRDFFPDLAHRIGGGMEKYFPWKTTEEYFEEYYSSVPGGFAGMRRSGIYVDPKKKPNYAPYDKPVKPEELEGSTTDEKTKIIYKGTDKDTGKPKAVGIWVNGKAVKGFNTPTRKLEVYSEFTSKKGKDAGKEVNPLPVYAPIPDHANLNDDDQLILTTFKWNVHNAHRTMQSKWLQEIVHANPAWMNPVTAQKLGIADGDWIEVTSYRPSAESLVPHADGTALGQLKTRVRLTHGIHPKALAISHNAGRWVGGPIATHVTTDAPGAEPKDKDTTRIWWTNTMSVPFNHLLPIYPDPRSGQQAYHDTVIRVRKA